MKWKLGLFWVGSTGVISGVEPLSVLRGALCTSAGSQQLRNASDGTMQIHPQSSIGCLCWLSLWNLQLVPTAQYHVVCLRQRSCHKLQATTTIKGSGMHRALSGF